MQERKTKKENEKQNNTKRKPLWSPSAQQTWLSKSEHRQNGKAEAEIQEKNTWLAEYSLRGLVEQRVKK